MADHHEATAEPAIDPSADVHPTATIGAGTKVGPGVIIGPGVTIGRHNTLHARCIIVRDTTIGDGNDIHPFAVIGGDPQDRDYNPQTPGTLVIGNDNTFREHTTLHRSTEPGPQTRIGHRNYCMVGFHVGHNCSVGDDNTFANYTMLAGHVRMGSGNVLSGSVGVHQFCNIGDGSMFQYGAGVSTHAPPYLVYATGINHIAALNKVGLKRNPKLTDQDRDEVRTVFRAVYRSKKSNPMLDRVEQLLAEKSWGEPATHFLTFIRDSIKDPDPRRSSRAVCNFGRT